MKRFCTALTALFILSIALAGSVFAEAGNPAEVKKVEADGYTISYEVVAQDQVDQVVGDLAQYINTEGVDMQKTRLLYIRYISAEKEGQEVKLGSALMNTDRGKFVFCVDGTEYTQTSLLMNTGTQTFLTYLFVPAETIDDADVSIKY